MLKWFFKAKNENSRTSPEKIIFYMQNLFDPRTLQDTSHVCQGKKREVARKHEMLTDRSKGHRD